MRGGDAGEASAGEASAGEAMRGGASAACVMESVGLAHLRRPLLRLERGELACLTGGETRGPAHALPNEESNLGREQQSKRST